MDSVIIILTTTVNVQNKCYLYQTDPVERLLIYKKSISQWLKTNFKIVVVENSGYTFPEFMESYKFEKILFNESELPEASYLRGNSSKGASELFSINYAIKNSKLIKPGDFIVKITGRYFIPDFNLEPGNFDAIIQNDRQSCEIIGSSYSYKDLIFNTSDILNGEPCNHIEFLYKNRILYLNKIMILKKLNIEGTSMGGAQVIRYSL
jgi:hypothetical protein